MEKSWTGYALGALGVVVATVLLKLPGSHINITTVALAFLLVVLFVATRCGSLPALCTSLLAMLSFNFFFLPPLGTFSIATTENWVALAAFMITALTAGQLSAQARRRAEEAETGRREIERLYSELRDAFERASHAEALQQSEKLKSALLDAVTHDLRTPLASIKASITTLLDEANSKTDQGPLISLDDESRLEMMEVINEESDRLNRFISGLIDLARIEAGELRLRRHWGAVEEIVAATLDRAKGMTRARNIKVDIEPELPVVRVDDRAVSEVLYTLLDNAMKYSPNHSPIVITAKRAAGDLIEISVTDQGPGIPYELRERVFDKFYRATNENSLRVPSGTGMGLAIAKGIVEAHRGNIWIENGDDGKGTRVIFTLPIGDDEPEHVAERPTDSIVETIH
ncbi:MAG TPA: ATP-binding protein [Pyrinomonadaceae bacterium]